MSTGEPAAPRAPVRVVVVDDAPDLRRLISMIVADAGGEVVGEAGDGLAGVALTRDARPDVVIMDWQMPVMDGVRATALIREALPATEVIAFSSAADPHVRFEFESAGAASYVQKGDLDGFTQALDKAAERVRRNRPVPPPTASPSRSGVSMPGSGGPKAPAGGLDIHVRTWPALARTFIAVHGTVDAITGGNLLEEARHALDLGHDLTLDVSEVTAIDAGGARRIREIIDLGAERGVEVAVQDPSPTVRHALKDAE